MSVRWYSGTVVVKIFKIYYVVIKYLQIDCVIKFTNCSIIVCMHTPQWSNALVPVTSAIHVLIFL